ncbi:MAG: polysaccharide biosynthesis tyrosine autokinase, partial [Actinomycetota bacterium]
LEDYLQAFGQRKWLVAAFAIFGLVLAFLYTGAAATTFTATSEIRLRPTPEGAVNNNLVAPQLEEESRVLGSDAVAAQVAATYPTVDREELDITFTPNSRILVASYTAPTAQEAAAIANEFATVYADQRTAAAVEYYQVQIEANEAALATIDENIAALEAERRGIINDRAPLFLEPPSETRTAQLEQAATELSRVDAELGNLRRDATTSRSAIISDQTEITTLQRVPPGEVLITAASPTNPDGIPRSLLLATGLLVGLVLGLISAFFLERLDTTARDEGDVALALGTTVMGAIPTLGLRNRGGSGSLIMFSSGGSARIASAREAFRRLRSSLVFLNSSNGVSSVIVTSSAPGEGKSLTASNLSIALAQNGSRVVLVSADLRRPSLERLFGMEAQRPGLAEYLSQTAELNAEKVPGIENLWLIRAGRPPANPGELLSSGRFELMVKELERENVEYIVVDTPPVLSTADALSAARYVDGVIVVVDAERTNTSDLLQVRADLERSGSKLLGAVINRRKFEGGGLFRRDKYAYYRAETRRLADQ